MKFLKISLISLLVIVMSSCRLTNTLISSEIIDTVVNPEESTVKYYTKKKTTVRNSGEISLEIINQEWTSIEGKDNKWRQSIHDGSELVSIIYNNGDTLVITEDKGGNIKYSNHQSKGEVDNIVLKKSQDTFMAELDDLTIDYDMEIIGSEKIAGRKALHVIFTNNNQEKKDEETLELWIDKKTYQIIKSIRSLNGDDGLVFEVEVLEYSDKVEFDESLFDTSIPKNAEKDTSIDEMMVSKDDIILKYGKNLLFYKNSQGYEESYSYSKYEGEASELNIININYSKNDIPMFSIKILTPDDTRYVPNTWEDYHEYIGDTLIMYTKRYNVINFIYENHQYIITSYNHMINLEELLEIARDLLEV